MPIYRVWPLDLQVLLDACVGVKIYTIILDKSLFIHRDIDTRFTGKFAVYQVYIIQKDVEFVARHEITQRRQLYLSGFDTVTLHFEP